MYFNIFSTIQAKGRFEGKNCLSSVAYKND